MHEDQVLEAPNQIDLREYLRILNKWRWVIALVTALAVATSGVLSFFVLPPVYETKATLMVMNAKPSNSQQIVQDVSGLQGVVNYVSRLPQLTINTYVSQLTSQAMLRRTAEAMEREGIIDSPQRLAGTSVKAKPIKDTNLVELTVTGTDASLLAGLANALTREFLKYISESNKDQLGRSVEFLDEQAKVVERGLADARQKLADFDSQPRGVWFLAQQVQTRGEDLNRYETQARQVHVEIRLLTAGLASAEEALVRTAREISVPVSKGAEPRLELNPAWTTLTQLAESKRVELAQREAEAAALDQAIGDLLDDLNGLQAEVTARRAERERLQSEVDRLGKTRDLLVDKITETRITRSVDLGQMNIEVVSPAQPPGKPIKPEKMMNLALAAVLGLMIGVALTFLLEYLDSTIKTAEDLQRQLGLPVLGSIPAVTAGDLRH